MDKEHCSPCKALFLQLERVITVSIKTQYGLGGRGMAICHRDSSGRLILNEIGVWDDSNSTRFSNILRWSLSSDLAFLQLEHLRYGFERPVHLVYIQHRGQEFFSSVAPHHCGKDVYSLKIDFRNRKNIELSWVVSGPKKAQSLVWKYSDF